MKKIVLILAALSLPITSRAVLAVCPACTIAVGAGLGLSRYLGVDDLISGVWVGGFTLSFSLWFINWLKKKEFKLPFLNWIILVFMYALVFLPLQLTGIIGDSFNKLWGIDKLILGAVFGSGVFLLAIFLDRKIRIIYGKQLFVYQKVVFPVVGVIILSIILYFLTK